MPLHRYPSSPSQSQSGQLTVGHSTFDLPTFDVVMVTWRVSMFARANVFQPRCGGTPSSAA